MSVFTPMMTQYISIKKSYENDLLFYRMGDFYELFFDDAVIAAKELDIVLTRRGKNDGHDIPMCGVPHHACESYIRKLIKKNYSIAICEQLETPEEAKKRGNKSVVKRDVVRVITPGTIIEDDLLDSNHNHYIVVIVLNNKDYASLVWSDISTGEIDFQTINIRGLSSEMVRLSPEEIIVSDESYHQIKQVLDHEKYYFTRRPNNFFDYKRSIRNLYDYYEVSDINAIGSFSDNEIIAIAVLIEYLNHTHRLSIPKLRKPNNIRSENFMLIDSATRCNLELDGQFLKSKSNNLLQVINKTMTASGYRLLSAYLSLPLLDTSIINERLNKVEYFYDKVSLRYEIRERLKNFPDVERALMRIASLRSSAKDLITVRDGLNISREIRELLMLESYHVDNQSNTDENADYIRSISDSIILSTSLASELERALKTGLITNNDFIKKGYSTVLDHNIKTRDKSKEILNELRDNYKKITGINTLRINKNNIIGYYVEVSSQHSSKIQNHEIFIHKQSLSTGIRYITKELKEFEYDLMSCNERIKQLEQEILNDLSHKIILEIENIFLTASAIAKIDVIANLAEVASQYNYSKPEVISSDQLGNFLNVIEGRHPIVENVLEEKYIANDCKINDDNNVLLITGPNMAGKSTFLRQNAIIAIMAQMGSFVPAQSVKMTIIDKLFSRIGSSDNISKGQSTFMVEMLETSNILNNATKNSLIILDEIGRGTANCDGLAIAQAVLEEIHDNIKARTLFATHYHDLTELENLMTRIKCFETAIAEANEKIIFLHKIVPGKSNKSYGINVAQLAGIPKNVIERAKKILKDLNISK